MSESKVRYCIYQCNTEVVDANNGTVYPNEVNTGKIHDYIRCSNALRSQGKTIPKFFTERILKDATHIKPEDANKKWPFHLHFRINRYGKVQLYTKGLHLDIGSFQEKENYIKLDNDLVKNMLSLAEKEATEESARKALHLVNSLDQYFGEPVK